MVNLRRPTAQSAVVSYVIPALFKILFIYFLKFFIYYARWTSDFITRPPKMSRIPYILLLCLCSFYRTRYRS